MKLAMVVVSLAGSCSLGLSCGYREPNLLESIAAADGIALVKIVGVCEYTVPAQDWVREGFGEHPPQVIADRFLRRLDLHCEVREILKGAPPHEIVLRDLWPRSIDDLEPPGPDELVGRTVVLFLREEEGAWLHALPPFVLDPGPTRRGADDVRDVVAGALALLGRGDIPREEELDWWVDAASRPAIRERAVQQLLTEVALAADGSVVALDEFLEEDGGIDPDVVDEDAEPEIVEWRPVPDTLLLPSHLEKLLESFLASPPESACSFVTMLAVTSRERDSRLDYLAVDRAEEFLARDESSPCGFELLTGALERFGSFSEVRSLLGSVGNGTPRDELRSTWAAARDALGLPLPGRPAPAEAPGAPISR